MGPSICCIPSIDATTWEGANQRWVSLAVQHCAATAIKHVHFGTACCNDFAKREAVSPKALLAVASSPDSIVGGFIALVVSAYEM